MIRQTYLFKPVIWLFVLLFSGIVQISGQTETKVKKWYFLAEPYLMFPDMQGETGMGSALTVPVDADAGDIFRSRCWWSTQLPTNKYRCSS